MGNTQASNAILAKARAMYGRRLTARNYQELLNCRDLCPHFLRHAFLSGECRKRLTDPGRPVAQRLGTGSSRLQAGAKRISTGLQAGRPFRQRCNPVRELLRAVT